MAENLKLKDRWGQARIYTGNESVSVKNTNNEEVLFKSDELFFGELLEKQWGVVVYALTSTLSNVTITEVDLNGTTLQTVPQTVTQDDTLTIEFTADAGHTLPSSVTVNGYSVPENTATATYGNCAADYETYQNSGTLTLTAFTGNTSFTASGASEQYTFTLNASGATVSSVTVNGTQSADLPALILPSDTVVILFDIDPANDYPQTVSVTNATGTVVTGGVEITNATGNVDVEYAAQMPIVSAANTGAGLPRTLSSLNGGMIDGVLYMLGGAGISGQYSEYLPIALKYDTGNNTVSNLSVTPPASVSRATAVSGDCLYLFGGYSDGGAGRTANKYDATNGTLTAITQLPGARNAAKAASYGNKIFIFGGQTGNTGSGISGLYSDTIYIYDTTTDSYTTSGTAMPYKMTPGTVIVYGDYAYIFGGTRVNDAGTSTTYTRQIFKFNLQTQVMSTANATLPYNSLEGGSWSAGLINGKIYLHVMTSRTSSSQSGWYYVYDPTADTMTDTNVSPYFATVGSAFGVAGNVLYMAGGIGTGAGYTSVIQKMTISGTPVATHTVAVTTEATSGELSVYDGSTTDNLLGTITGGTTETYTITNGYITIKSGTSYVSGNPSTGIDYYTDDVWRVTADGTLTYVTDYHSGGGSND